MEIRNCDNTQNIELPLQLRISFRKVVEIFQKYATTDLKEHPFHQSAKLVLNEIEKQPELITGFSDFSFLENNKSTVSLLLDILFPEALTHNEIKAATIPFSFISFKFTERFKEILQNAGDEYILKVRNFEDDMMYIISCTLILATVYNHPVDLKRPFFFDIPDKKLGVIKHYRARVTPVGMPAGIYVLMKQH